MEQILFLVSVVFRPGRLIRPFLKLTFPYGLQVWVSAVGQNLSSIGIAFGLVISFASYNRYNNNILVDTVTITAINGLSSFAVGLFTFATLGSMAKEYGKSVEDVIPDGIYNSRLVINIIHRARENSQKGHQDIGLGDRYRGGYLDDSALSRTLHSPPDIEIIIIIQQYSRCALSDLRWFLGL